MTEPVYEKLADAVNARGGAILGMKCKEFFALLEELFTPEEAELATTMPPQPVSAETLATGIGRDYKELENILETMANKGLIFSHDRDGVRFYNLMVLLPGIFEMQFMSGEVNDRTKKLARLFDDYFEAVRQPSAAATAPRVVFPFARVITVEQEIPSSVGIHPYDKVSEYIANADDIAVGTCYCRHHGELVGRPCDKPKDVCMAFGPQARYIAERGFGRRITKEEAIEVLDRSEKAGLVHCSSNTGKYLDFICNCCGCHCGILRSIKMADVPSAGANSSFMASVNEEECIGCGDCLARCWMEALTLEGDIVAIDARRCIGCGLCISACPTGALTLQPREDALVPPTSHRDLNASMISSVQQNQ